MRVGNKQGSFAGRHITAGIISSLSLPIGWTIAYLVLLGIAIATGTDLGGPLALPGGLLLGFAVSLGYTFFLLFPATALAEVCTKRLTKWKYLVQAAVAFILLAAFIAFYSLIIQILRDSFNLGLWLAGVSFFQLLLAIPLGVYWWAAKLSNIIIGTVRSIRDWILPRLAS